MNIRLVTLCLACLLSTGCVSSMVDSAVSSAIRAADESVREKWKEEWKPLIAAEIKGAAAAAEDAVLEKVDEKVGEFKETVAEKIDAGVQSRLDTLGVNASDADKDGSGDLNAKEALGLMKQLKAANDKKGKPFSLIELGALFAAIYGGGSGLKGAGRMMAKKNGTGDGGEPAA